MMNNPRTRNSRILVIDDNRSIHEDIQKILCRREPSEALVEAKALLFGDPVAELDRSCFEMDFALQGEEGLHKVQDALASGRPYALAFVDIRMPPGWDGVETVKRIWLECPDIQIVICTAYADYSWDEMMQQIGKSDSWVILKKPFDTIEVLQLAHSLSAKWHLDHQLKAQLSDLDQRVRQRTTELSSANLQLEQEISERKQIEKALRASEERFSLAFEASPMASALQSLTDGNYINVNTAFARLTGHTRMQLTQTSFLASTLWVDTLAWLATVSELQNGQAVRERRAQIRSYDGRLHEIMFSAQPLQIGTQACALAIMQDVTEQLRLENDLRQSQKMEAIGQLAAGIAHDFNNLLTVILCCCAGSLENPGLDPELRDNLEQVRGASERAAKLTRQLLVFTRKQVIQPKALDVAATLYGLRNMLNRIISEHIEIIWDCPAGLPPILADEGNLEQIVVNLIINARDALPDGGQINVKLGSVILNTETSRRHLRARPGQFLSLAVIDNGSGMDDRVMQHLFEPFFTTKPVGKGTGLGLSTVYAVMLQHGGWIEVTSELGKGSTFTLFFPVKLEKPTLDTSAPRAASSHVTQPGRERILLVEDDPSILTLLKIVLKRSGYIVTDAKDGSSALDLCSSGEVPYDLLITDMVMPNGVTGAQLAQRLESYNPQLKTILMTGYSTELLEPDTVHLKSARVLLKPFTHDVLLRLIREVMDPPDRS